MSVFTAAYDPGHPEPDFSVPTSKPATSLSQLYWAFLTNICSIDIKFNYDNTIAPKNLDESNDSISNAADILDTLMRNRFSCRYYLPQPVDKAIIEKIIDAARYSPSGNNMQ